MQVVDSLRKGHQAMVFVHSRKDTGKSARMLVTKAQNSGDGAIFDCSDLDAYAYMARDVKRSRNKCTPPWAHPWHAAVSSSVTRLSAISNGLSPCGTGSR